MNKETFQRAVVINDELQEVEDVMKIFEAQYTDSQGNPIGLLYEIDRIVLVYRNVKTDNHNEVNVPDKISDILQEQIKTLLHQQRQRLQIEFDVL
jgi:hypothetical protein